jgi:hypothetical protein
MVIGLCVFVWISCIQDVEDVVYTVTVTQPAGGRISASPESGPAGTVVTLTNVPAANYTFSRYTVDGAAITGSTFTLNNNVTVSGVFTYTGSGQTYTVTITRPAGGRVSASPESGPAGTEIALTNSPDDDYAFSHYTVDGAAITGSTFSLNKDVTVSGVFTPKSAQSNSITIGNITATLDPDTGELVIPDYADPAAIGPITLSAEDKGKLASKTLSVDIQKGTGASDTVSLAYVHYLREALLSAAPAGVAIDGHGPDAGVFG